MNLRLILWTVGMAYASFLLARGNGASSFGAKFIAPFLGAAIGFGLGVAWGSRRLAASVTTGAFRSMDKVRDEHWLENNPIDYA